MFIAMNRFRIAPGKEDGFEEVWRRRDSLLENEWNAVFAAAA